MMLLLIPVTPSLSKTHLIDISALRRDNKFWQLWCHKIISMAREMSESESVFDTTDGRRLRSRDSKRKIVAAMLELVREGRIAPTAEEVAQRANVGLRTVFRRFKDMESLYAEMAIAIGEQVAPIVDPALGDNTWAQNFTRLVTRRLRVYEVIMPYRVAAEVLKFQSDVLLTHHLNIVRTERERLKAVISQWFGSAYSGGMRLRTRGARTKRSLQART